MAIDFKKLMEQSKNETREERNLRHQKWLDQQPWALDQKKCEELFSYTISNDVEEWDRGFIASVYRQVVFFCKEPSSKQKIKIDEFYEKYIVKKQ